MAGWLSIIDRIRNHSGRLHREGNDDGGIPSVVNGDMGIAGERSTTYRFQAMPEVPRKQFNVSNAMFTKETLTHLSEPKPLRIERPATRDGVHGASRPAPKTKALQIELPPEAHR